MRSRDQHLDREINISVANPSRIRLVVDGKNMAQRWAPRDGTLTSGDRPEQVPIDGQRYWAIPPNVNLDEAVVHALNTYTGFASKWAMPPTLAPGATAGGGTQVGDGGVTYDGPDRDSDLVFQVPVDSAGAPIDIVGVGVFDIRESETGGEVWTLVGLAPFDEWGPQLAPGFF